MSDPVSRRAVLRRAVLAAAGAALAPWDARRVFAQSRPRFTGYPFTLGVASGSPRADGVVIWTRLAPEPLAEGGGMAAENVTVAWEVARDEGFGDVVRSGTRVAYPERAHSVHVEVDGLDQDRGYFYRFRAGAETSVVGRTRTAAAGRAPQVRAGLLPALRAGLLRGLPPHGRRRPRPGRVRGRLHLRVLVGRDTGPPPRRGRDANARRVPAPLRPVPDRSRPPAHARAS